LSVALLLVSAAASAQWTPSRRFGVREGLAQSQVAAVVLDATGYLWVGTQAGLSRFDGRRFVTLTTVDGLPDDVVSALAADADGNLWIGTDSGALARWDRHRVTALAGAVPWRGPVSGLSVLASGSLLVGTADGLFLGTPGAWRRVVSGDVTAMTGSAGGVAVVAGGALHSVSGEGSDRALGLPEGLVPVAVAASGSELWVGTAQGRIVRLPAGVVEEGLDPAVDTIQSLLPSRDGGLWIGGQRSLWWRDRDGRLAARVLHPSERLVSVRALLEDREGSLWVGTWGQGLFQQTPGSMTLFTTESGLPSSTVWTLAEGPDGCVWMGTEHAGVVTWCEDGWHPQPGLNRSLPTQRVLTVAWGSDGTFWVGTQQGLLAWRQGSRPRLLTRRDGLPHDFVRSLAPTPDGGLWIATSGGLARWDGARMQSFTTRDGLPEGPVRSLAVDSGGALWLATHAGGVLRFDGTRFTAFTTSDGLPHNRVWSLVVDSHDRVWAGTDAGLWVHPAAGGPDQVLAAGSGLPSLNVLFLLEDLDGFMWVGTTRGVSRVSAEGKVVRTFTAQDGFADSEAAENAALRDRAGLLWFGMASGVTRVDPRHLLRNTVPPALVMQAVLVNGAAWTDGALPASGLGRERPVELVLGPGTGEVRFEFAALSFLSPDQVRFRFMLEGFDPTWSAPTDDDHATYRRLPPGAYRFLLSASNNEGVWAAEPVAMTLRILPAWYQTRAFRLGSGLLGLLAVASVFGARAVAHRRRQRELEAEVAARTADLLDANARITEQNRLLEELSRTDPLTGLANRRVLGEQLPLEMALLRRELLRHDVTDLASHHGIGLLMLDIDHFKAVNDRWGHEAGDRVLQAVAAGLAGALREVDLAVRHGGEEFVVLARGVDREGLQSLARRLGETVAALAVPVAPGEVVRPSISIGFVPYPLGRSGHLRTGEWSRLLEAADKLLYVAKMRGRGRACGRLWRPGAPSPASEEETLEALIRYPQDDHPGLELVELAWIPPQQP
jgi:diguanylate cyclase (GGDEF)-like protein